MNKSVPTIERYLRILQKKEIVEFRGARKTGGYYFWIVSEGEITFTPSFVFLNGLYCLYNFFASQYCLFVLRQQLMMSFGN